MRDLRRTPALRGFGRGPSVLWTTHRVSPNFLRCASCSSGDPPPGGVPRRFGASRRLRVAIEAPLGRPQTTKRRPTMIIGNFIYNHESDRYSGEIKTLTLHHQVVSLQPVESKQGKGPDY